MARLLAKITTIGNHYELPSEGFFTLNDPTSGSGILLLAAVEEAIRNGLNPSEQLVIQASDCDIACAQMTYIHLSLYGIPAVVVQGDCISMKEYSQSISGENGYGVLQCPLAPEGTQVMNNSKC